MLIPSLLFSFFFPFPPSNQHLSAIVQYSTPLFVLLRKKVYDMILFLKGMNCSLGCFLYFLCLFAVFFFFSPARIFHLLVGTSRLPLFSLMIIFPMDRWFFSAIFISFSYSSPFSTSILTACGPLSVFVGPLVLCFLFSPCRQQNFR